MLCIVHLGAIRTVATCVPLVVMSALRYQGLGINPETDA
jgi:hypothetical protein